MRIVRLTEREQRAMRRAGRCAAEVLDALVRAAVAGVRCGDLDARARREIARRGARSSQLGYRGFPAAVCVSRNAVACHGIPGDEVLEPGDLVSIDVTVELEGYHGDTCRTVVVGDASPDARPLVEVARRACEVGVAQLRDGARLGDVGAAIDALARREGCAVVTEVGGHGIGRRMHLPPHVDHVGVAGRGRRLRAGMALTVEPILTLGGPDLRLDDDGWTLRTSDGSLAAQFEHTLLVTGDGAEVLTDLR